MIYWIDKLRKADFLNIAYALLFLALFIRLAVRILQQISCLELSRFHSRELWYAFFGVVLFHSALLFICSSSSKLKIYSGPFLYLNTLFGFYFAVLVNHCFLHFPDRAILFGTLLGIIGLFYIPFRFNLGKTQFHSADILIGLWLIHSVLFFAEYNFDVNRAPYGDEATFWQVVAEKMVTVGVLNAQLPGYPTGGLHPFGVPFVTALPLLFMKGLPRAGLYFMPVITIMTMLFFLRRLNRRRWAFLFFLCCLFCAFNNRSWMGNLLYQLVYGEGLNTMIFLWFTYEIIHWPETSRLWQKFLLSFFIGLLALTKTPLSLFFAVFIIIFLIRNRRQLSFPATIACLVLAGLPWLLWKFFVIKCHIHQELLTPFSLEIFSRLLNPNGEFLSLVFRDLWQNADGFVYFFILSAMLWLVFSKKIMEGLPAIGLLVGTSLYYAYGYSYGSTTGDYGSFLRYVMPASLAMYYLGAIGLENVAERLRSSSSGRVFKILIFIVAAGLMVHKLF